MADIAWDALRRDAERPAAERFEDSVRRRLAEMAEAERGWRLGDNQHGSVPEALGLTMAEYVEYVLDPREFVVRHYLTGESDG